MTFGCLISHSNCGYRIIITEYELVSDLHALVLSSGWLVVRLYAEHVRAGVVHPKRLVVVMHHPPLIAILCVT